MMSFPPNQTKQQPVHLTRMLKAAAVEVKMWQGSQDSSGFPRCRPTLRNQDC